MGGPRRLLMAKGKAGGYRYWKVRLNRGPGFTYVAASEIQMSYDGARHVLTGKGITCETPGVTYSGSPGTIQNLIDGYVEMNVSENEAYISAPNMTFVFDLGEPKLVTAVWIGPQAYAPYPDGTVNQPGTVESWFSADGVSWSPQPGPTTNNYLFNNGSWSPGNMLPFPTGF